MIRNNYERIGYDEEVLDIEKQISDELDKIENEDIERHGLLHQNIKNKVNLDWVEWLHIYSVLGIIFLETNDLYYEKKLSFKGSSDVLYYCIYNCIARFSVPVFLTTIGIRCLNPNKSFIFKNFLIKCIFRMVTSFLFWDIINSFVFVLNSNNSLFSSDGIIEFLLEFLNGGGYWWIYLTLFGCCLCVPILRSFASNGFTVKYFLILWLFWGSLLPTVKHIVYYIGFDDPIYITASFIDHFNFRFAAGFIGYFVAGGYFINHGNIKSHDNRVRLVYLCILDVALFTGLTVYDELENKHYSNIFRNYETLFVAYYSFAVVAFFKNIIGSINFPEKVMKIISKISSLSIGAYLIHIVFKEMMKNFNFYPDHIGVFHFTPVIGVPLMFIINCILSYLSAYIVSNIPVLKDFAI